VVSLSPSTTFSSLSLFFLRPGLPGPFLFVFAPSPARHTVAPPALLLLFPPLSPLFFVLSLLPLSHIRSALFCPFLCFLPHSRLTPCPFTPHATIFSLSCVTTSNEDFLFPTHASCLPPPCIVSALHSPPPRPATPPQWTLAAPAPWHPPVTSVPLPKKTFFLRVFRPCFCQKFLLYLSCRPLYKTYIFTNIYCHTITICMQENIARLGGASRGGGGVFSREPFFKGPRGLRNGFLWGSSACRNGRNDRTGGRGRVAGRRNGTGNRFFGGPGRRNGEGNRFFGGPGPSSE